jgi:MFS family permease
MSEIVPTKMRGGLVDIHAIGFVSGYTLQGWIGVGFYFWNNKNAWRVPLAFQCVCPLILLCGMYWIPESPRFLIMRGRVDEAKVILTRLHQRHKEDNSVFVAAELYQIQKQAEVDSKMNSSWLEMFRRPSYRKRCLYTLALTYIVQASGVLTINSKSSFHNRPFCNVILTYHAQTTALPFIETFITVQSSSLSTLQHGTRWL